DAPTAVLVRDPGIRGAPEGAERARRAARGEPRDGASGDGAIRSGGVICSSGACRDDDGDRRSARRAGGSAGTSRITGAAGAGGRGGGGERGAGQREPVGGRDADAAAAVRAVDAGPRP